MATSVNHIDSLKNGDKSDTSFDDHRTESNPATTSEKYSNHTLDHKSKSNDAKERKFDLNSFSVKQESEDDDDDVPLSTRKQKSDPKLDSSAAKNGVRNKQTADTSNSGHKASKANVSRIISDDEEEEEAEFKNKRTSIKREVEENEDDDDVPLMARAKKVKKDEKHHNHSSHKNKQSKSRKRHSDEDENEEDDDDDDYKDEDYDAEDIKPPSIKKKAKTIIKIEAPPSPTKKVGGRKKKEEEEQEVWRWWEEKNQEDGIKWKFLEHKGPLFAPGYVPVPSDVKFYYDGKHMKLSQEAEEVASFYSKMLDHDYVLQEVFNKNFFKDWRKVMTAKEKEIITDLKKCDFKELHAYYMKQSEERRNRSKEEKQKEKEEKDQIQKDMGTAVIDGHKEKIGNFRIEPPGLFRGRGTHPKMGMLKKRVQPEDVIINCSKDSKIPVPPPGHKWKEIKHDNTVSWLASWSENIMGSIKYVMLNPSSKIKGEKDWQKYETARKLKSRVQKIRENYKEDLKSKEMKVRQRAVALYFIDKLALRAGNEKEEGETADTVGCCSLRCEHIKLHDSLDGEEHVVEFDFLGKDSIRYYNKVPVEKRVFKNLKLFMENKTGNDDLFDRLNTTIMNKHLSSLMDGLTAKVFRTYNASFTLQEQLDLLTKADMSPTEKLLSYNRANRQVAILCNHQRSVPKGHSKQMEALQEKIKEKLKQVTDAKTQMKDAKKEYKESKSERTKKNLELKQKVYERHHEQLQKLQVKATDKEENKEIALGTSKLNYLDPRISVAWCKKWNVPIDKVYNKTQRDKFRWAIDMAGPEFSW